MNEIQKKSLVIAVILGLEYILSTIFSSLFIYLFILMAVTVLLFGFYYFEIKKELNDFIDKSKFLIIPGLFNLSAFLYISSLANSFFRIFFVIISLVVDYCLFVALKRVQNKEDRSAIFQRNIIISIAFLTLLFSLSAIFKFYVSFSTSRTFNVPISAVVLSVGLIYYFLIYFLSWENGMDMKKMIPYNMAAALVASEIALISTIWIVNYPVFSGSEKANLGGFPLPAIYLTIVFYFIWGIISHKMDKSLTRRVMTEYVAISIVFLLVLVATAKWLPII